MSLLRAIMRWTLLILKWATLIKTYFRLELLQRVTCVWLLNGPWVRVLVWMWVSNVLPSIIDCCDCSVGFYIFNLNYINCSFLQTISRRLSSMHSSHYSLRLRYFPRLLRLYLNLNWTWTFHQLIIFFKGSPQFRFYYLFQTLQTAYYNIVYHLGPYWSVGIPEVVPVRPIIN